MSRRAQAALLAFAALGSLAFAGVRIGRAASSGPVRQLLIPVYGTSSGAEAATLAAVRAPTGFHRFHPCPEGVCFVRHELLPLNAPTTRRLTEAVGASPARRGPHLVECDLRGLRACEGDGVIGIERVIVWVSRPEVATHESRTRRNRRTFRAFRVLRATEIQVTVIGHCLHVKECEALGE